MSISNIFSTPGRITKPTQPSIQTPPSQAPDPMLGTPNTPPAPNWRRGVSGMDRVGGLIDLQRQQQAQRPQAWQDRLASMQQPQPPQPFGRQGRLTQMPQAPQPIEPQFNNMAPQQPQDHAALREALMGMRR